MYKFIKLKGIVLKHHLKINFQFFQIPSPPFMWINMENEDDAPQELLEVGPCVHLTQCPVRDCRKNTSTQGHPPQTCSSGELLFVLTVCQHSVCDIHKEKKNVFNQTFPRLFSLDGQHQGRKSNRKTSQQFIAVGNQMSGYQI